MPKQHTLLSFPVVITVLVLILLLSLVLQLTSWTGNVISTAEKPILIITDVTTKSIQQDNTCIATIQGKISNNGNTQAENILIECTPALYPEIKSSKEQLQKTYNFAVINSQETKEFLILIPHRCDEHPRFVCEVIS